jgi:hypothetical protein
LFGLADFAIGGIDGRIVGNMDSEVPVAEPRVDIETLVRRFRVAESALVAYVIWNASA